VVGEVGAENTSEVLSGICVRVDVGRRCGDEGTENAPGSLVPVEATATRTFGGKVG
jgi:hypothetical protein